MHEQTSTGIKDRHLLYFLEKIHETADRAKESGANPAEVAKKLRELRQSWPQSDDELFNPTFSFPGMLLCIRVTN